MDSSSSSESEERNSDSIEKRNFSTEKKREQMVGKIYKGALNLELDDNISFESVDGGVPQTFSLSFICMRKLAAIIICQPEIKLLFRSFGRERRKNQRMSNMKICEQFVAIHTAEPDSAICKVMSEMCIPSKLCRELKNYFIASRLLEIIQMAQSNILKFEDLGLFIEIDHFKFSGFDADAFLAHLNSVIVPKLKENAELMMKIVRKIYTDGKSSDRILLHKLKKILSPLPETEKTPDSVLLKFSINFIRHRSSYAYQYRKTFKKIVRLWDLLELSKKFGIENVAVSTTGSETSQIDETCCQT